MRFFVYIFSFVCLLSNSFIFAQEGRLAAFNAVKLNDENVEVRWTLKANVSCQSPQVQRGLDSLSFETVYIYPGVCGGTGEEESYSWIDSDLLPASKIYYRLRIDDGEYSQIDVIEQSLPLEGDQVRIFPNPSGGQFDLQYEPSLGRPNKITIYELSGAEVVDLKASVQLLRRGQFKLDLTEFRSAIYLIRISFENGTKELKVVKE